MTDETMTLTVFDSTRATLAELEKKDESLVFDHTTPEGEKGLRSWVQRLRGYKSDVAKVHKEKKALSLAFGRKVDAIKNELTAGTDKIITERMKPLDEKKAKERAEAEAIVEAELVEKYRIEKERLGAIIKREKETARKEAEIKAETDRLAREREQLEFEKRAEEDAKRRETEARERAERVAEQEKAATIAKIEHEKQVAIEAEKEKARKIETDRLEKEATELAEQEVAALAERKRVENKAHRREVENSATKAIVKVLGSEELAAKMMFAIKKNKITYVTINYGGL